jgi:hypothetical protein
MKTRGSALSRKAGIAEVIWRVLARNYGGSGKALERWTYQPYTLGGEPISVKTEINVVFHVSP